MRLDHVSYVTSHDQLSDTVQRLGQRLGSTFVDGGMHPRFGTRNFTLPLEDGTYLESTPNHRWLVVNSENNEYEWVKTEDLTDKYYFIDITE